MPDSNAVAHPFDAKKININTPYGMKLWIRMFECADVQLKRMVYAVGPSAMAISKHLKK